MAIIGETQFLERIQFFNGQRLFADDLQTLEAFNREMRWLHNQSLHQPGVGSGYAITGNIGDRAVVISPGYALDSEGREIILTESLTLAIPPVADNGSGGSVFYFLTVSYPADSDLKTSETRAGICVEPGVVRLREDPVFCWVRLNDNDLNRQPVDENLKTRISKGVFIVLAQIEVLNCKLKQPVSSVQRRNALPARQPRIACDVFPVKWAPKPAAGMSNPIQIGDLVFTAKVDTSGGKFQATPAYVARIEGDRLFPGDASNNKRPIFVDALVSITAPTQSEFIIQIFPFCNQSFDLPTVLSSWKVAWMGIES
ncbi:MAG TPA: hypothetical protein VLK33_00865 [Terriglobales bacterium]|nr:hypothetical protein [Terriglobales bacterium]